MPPHKSAPVFLASKDAFINQTDEPRPVHPSRLVVLVPDCDIDETELASRIWKMASSHRLGVLFLGLSRTISEEASLRRRLINLSALTRDPSITVETRLEFGKDWLVVLRSFLGIEDVLIFLTGHNLNGRGKPSMETLSVLGVPVWPMEGLYDLRTTSSFSRSSEVAFWAVSLMIIIGFSVIQTKILRLQGDWSLDVLLSLTLLVEIGLIYAWHHLTS